MTHNFVSFGFILWSNFYDVLVTFHSVMHSLRIDRQLFVNINFLFRFPSISFLCHCFTTYISRQSSMFHLMISTNAVEYVFYRDCHSCNNGSCAKPMFMFMLPWSRLSAYLRWCCSCTELFNRRMSIAMPLYLFAMFGKCSVRSKTCSMLIHDGSVVSM
jgi:hypothetical protein